MVRNSRLVIEVKSLAQHDLVLSSPEGIPKHCDGAKINVAVTTFSLVCARTIEVPYREFFMTRWFGIYCLRFTPHGFAGSINPNVQDLNSLALIKAHVFVEKRPAFCGSHL